MSTSLSNGLQPGHRDVSSADSMPCGSMRAGSAVWAGQWRIRSPNPDGENIAPPAGSGRGFCARLDEASRQSP